MPPKFQTQLPSLTPYARTLLTDPESLRKVLNLLVGALNGLTITDIHLAGALSLQENATAYTIATGAIDIEEGSGQNTASRSSITVDTESSAATDDLDTISNGRDGQLLFLRPANAARTIVLTAAGNIAVSGRIELANTDQLMMLQYNETLTKWLAVGDLLSPFKRTETAISYQILDTDDFIAVTNTDAPRTITLPTAVGRAGKSYIIKDESGGAATNNITIATTGAETIDGAATAVITANYGLVRVESDGANWFTMSPHHHDGTDHYGTIPLSGELGGTNTAATVDATHSGSAHHTKYLDSEAIAAVEGEQTLDLTGDVTWVGAGKGLQFGEIWAKGNAVETSIGGAGTFVQLTIFTNDGQSNGATPANGEDHITIGKTGKYLILASFHVESIAAGAADIVAVEIRKNNGDTAFSNLHAHRKLAGGGGDIGSVSISGLADLTANDTIEVWIANEDNATNLLMEDANLSLVQVGG